MTKVAEIMTDEVVTVVPELSLRETLDVLRGENVSGAPVVQSQRVVGVVSLTDILEFEATTPGVPTSRPEHSEWGELEAPEMWAEGDEPPSAFFVDYWADAGAEITARIAEPESPEWDVLEEHVVAEVMTRKVVALPPDAAIEEAARLMYEGDIHRVLVMVDDTLRGIVTTTDIVRTVAERDAR